MTPSGLISAVTFLIVVPTTLVFRLLTLLNLNAVALYYPLGLPPHENGSSASVDNSPILESDFRDQTIDSLPLWLTHILQNHNLSQSIPLRKGQDAPVAVSIHLTVDFVQPSFDHSFDQMVTINSAEPKLQNGSSQVISPSNSTARLHGESGPDDNEYHELDPEKPFQPAVVIDLLIQVLGLTLVCFAAWRQVLYPRSSYRSLIRLLRKSRAAVPLRGCSEYANAHKNPKTPSYENIVSEENDIHDYPPTHAESSIREWTPEDDYETEVTNITEPDAITLPPWNLVSGFEEPRLLGIAPGSSCSETRSHPESSPCGDSDYTFVDAGVTIRPERELSLSHCESDPGLQCPRSRGSPLGSRPSLLLAEDSELGNSGTLDSSSIGDDQRTSLEVSESGYFTNAEVLLVHGQHDPPRHTQETSLIHIPGQLASQRDPSVVTSRELVLYLSHPRAWEVDDIVAAWRCFIQSRRGRKWVAYGIFGIAVLLQTILADFLASCL